MKNQNKSGKSKAAQSKNGQKTARKVQSKAAKSKNGQKTAKKVQSKAVKSKRGQNILKKVQGDEVLAKLTGLKSGPRCEYVKQIWRYIKKHQLQTKEDGRIITPDNGLAKLMGVEGQRINAFTMARYIEKHLVKE